MTDVENLLQKWARVDEEGRGEEWTSLHHSTMDDFEKSAYNRRDVTILEAASRSGEKR